MSLVRYDAIIVLGQKQTDNWELPKDLEKRLDEAVELFNSGESQTLIVCGRWAIHFDLIGVAPPITEAKMMKKYLVKKGVPPTAIVMEQHSKDTIGNAYYLKQILRRKYKNSKDFLIICGKPHLSRVQYIFGHIFGVDFNFCYLGTNVTEFPNTQAVEQVLLRRTKDFFGGMLPGQDDKLRRLLYRSNKYRKQILNLE